MTPSAILERLRGVQKTGTGWVAFCPAHDDRAKRSLSVKSTPEGKTLLYCFTGCSVEAVVGAVGLTLRDLMPPGQGAARRIVATYDYCDESGTLLYQVVRYDPKDFRPRRPDGTGGWLWTLGDVRRVVYRLQDLAEQTRVLHVEGEKDADRLWSLGLAATTTQGGSSAWRDDYAPQVVAAGVQEVACLADNDEAGEHYAQAAARAYLAHGLRVKIVRLPDLPHKGDVSTWLDAGHTVEALEAVLTAEPWLTAPPAATPAGVVTLATAVDEWLAAVESGHVAPVARTPFPSLNHLLVGGFGPGELIYVGARPGVGKTALGLEFARTVAADGAAVLVVSREMVTQALTRRMIAQAARVSASNIRRGRLEDGEWVMVRDALPKLRQLPVWLTDKLVTVDEITDLVRGLVTTPPLGLLMVDYLQLVRGPSGIRDRRLEVESVSQALKALAVEQRIPVLCLSSLSRAANQKDARPTLERLRESGELEHDADIVLLLYRERMAAETECIVAKNRDGRTGTVRLCFRADYVTFDEVSDRGE